MNKIDSHADNQKTTTNTSSYFRNKCHTSDHIPKGTVKDVYRRTIEIRQCTRISKANYGLKVHNAPLKLASPISG